MPAIGYYDGNVVRTEAQFDNNQRVLIIPITADYFEDGTAAGMLHEYANLDLISSEKEAWRKAAIKKNGQMETNHKGIFYYPLHDESTSQL